MVKTKRDKKIVAELRRFLTMEVGAFNADRPGGRDVTVRAGEITAFIKHETHLWRHTWLLPLLDELERGKGG